MAERVRYVVGLGTGGLHPLCELTDHINISRSSSVSEGSYGPAKRDLGSERASGDRKLARG